jgi:hypothetical protein
MISYIILSIGSTITSFLLGLMYARKKNKKEHDTAIMVIANLKATIEVYKITNEEQKKYFRLTTENNNAETIKLRKSLERANDENKIFKREVARLNEKLKILK